MELGSEAGGVGGSARGRRAADAIKPAETEHSEGVRAAGAPRSGAGGRDTVKFRKTKKPRRFLPAESERDKTGTRFRTFSATPNFRYTVF